MPTPSEAFAALRAGGLKHNDPDLVRLFDVEVPDYVVKARAAKPELFNVSFDARTASAADCKRQLESFARQDFERRAADSTAAFLAKHASKGGR